MALGLLRLAIVLGRSLFADARPTSRMGALLWELCVEYGWCLPLEDSRALRAAGPQDRETVIDSIIRAECGEDDVRDEDTRAFLRPIVDDLLFDPAGRGARSELPL